MDYLLKPIDEKELDAALCKFERRNCPTPKTPAYRQLEETYLSNNKKNRFLIQLGDAFQYVKTDEIAFFYSEEKYTYLHLFSNRRYIINYSLEQLEKMLDKDAFFRVSRNCIANIRSITKISKFFASRLKLYFQPECPHEILISRNRVSDFLKWVDDAR